MDLAASDLAALLTATATERGEQVAIVGADGAEVTWAQVYDDVTRVALSPTRARIQLAWAPWTDLASGLRAMRS